TRPEAMMAQVTRMDSTLATLLKGIAIIALFAGAAVITGLMLISVSERRTEIGLRRAVGASRLDILLQFLVEALIVSGCGGLLGILIGLGATEIAATVQKMPPIFALQAMAWVAATAIGVGLLSGIYPALKAASTDPALALRP